ncbi:polysaccharide deacetylase family protein [uncultured Dubosiella sp.]|uniref:polysaccharide deacetylase family protein n=3 Tax=uncultured Dubosiella sp. TaxID=1937011 RepID=UPI0025FD0CB2|nr:polysaccharide deacetylase family protein [uncultured Dubosiella sp.]
MTMKRKKKKRRLRLGRLLAVLCIPLLLIAGIYVIYLNFNPVQLYSRDVVAEYKEKYDPKSNIKFVFRGSKDDVKIDGNIDTNKKGEYPIKYVYNDHSATARINVKDTKPPELALKDTYIDMTTDFDPSSLVDSAEDAGKIKYSYDFDKATIDERGKHKVSVTAEDEDGNSVTKTATLYREEDTKAPQLKDRKQTLSIMQGQLVSPDMLKVEDEFDPSPKIEIDDSSYDSTEPGEGTVTFTVSDRSGNSDTITLPLNVKKDPAYGKKVVYLTFDDGPSRNTKKILDILNKYDAKATFFVTGNHPEFNDYIKEAYKDGNTIGLHTYTHDYATLYSSKDAYYKDLQQISDMVEDLTGEKSMIIRFPGGSSNMISAQYTPHIMSELTQEVRDKGYQYFDWNVDSTDASGNNVPAAQIVEHATGSDEQYINILMHDTDAKNTTVEALEEIIKYYKDQGYVFLGLDTSSYPAHHTVQN